MLGHFKGDMDWNRLLGRIGELVAIVNAHELHVTSDLGEKLTSAELAPMRYSRFSHMEMTIAQQNYGSIYIKTIYFPSNI